MNQTMLAVCHINTGQVTSLQKINIKNPKGFSKSQKSRTLFG